MKKYLSILSITGLLLFTACSKDDLAQQLSPEEQAAIIAEANMDSEVEIRLGFGSQSSSNSVTRAPLESEAVTGFFETPANQYLGIYCLAQKPQTTPATPGSVAEGSINWTSEANTLQYLLTPNHPARVVKITHGADKYIGNVPLTTEDACDVQFLNPDNLSQQMIYFYPYGNWYNYHFYGYYPRQTTGITETANKVTVDYTIDGTQDIIYAKATPVAADIDKGFNAKYMRSLQDANGYNQLSDLPMLALSHKLTQLRFFVKCSSGTYNTYGYGTTIGDAAPYKKLFQIQDVTLKDVPDGWTLTIAERGAVANEGVLTRKGTSTSDIHIKQMTLDNTGAVATSSDDDAFNQTTPANTRVNIPFIAQSDNTTQPTMLGYAMIPTTAMMTDAPQITFTIYSGATKDSGGNDVAGTEYTSEKMSVDLPTNGLEAGKVYNVVLNIPPPEEIHMHATLDVWEVVATPIDMTIE